MIIAIIVVVVLLAGWHSGHVHSNYRHGRARGHRGVNLFWSSSRGAWASIPGPLGFRVEHKL